MTAKMIIPVLLFFVARDVGAQSPRGQELPKFMGRQVTVVEPELDEDGFFPKGPASICLAGPPQRQCYTAPEGFGRSPSAEVIQLDKNTSALLFTAASGGVSGWDVHFALLRPGSGAELDDLFPSITVSAQSQHAFWNDSAISDAAIFLTASYVWGPDEGHYGFHRYIISAYTRKLVSGDSVNYYLEDQYMTTRYYDLDANDDILTSEKQEILARLRRVEAERKRPSTR
jgi:hypothetical protein